MKWILLTLVLLVLSITGLLTAGYVYLDHELRPNTDKTQVIGLPQGHKIHPIVQPYLGAHPSTLVRPEESFQFPIPLGETGPVKPLFAGPPEYPFLCMTQESKLGQPLVDNQDQVGVPVYEVQADGSINRNTITGYSKDCSIPTQIHYYYQENPGDNYRLFNGNNQVADNRPSAHSWLRVEVGTINRFLYALIIPTTQSDLPSAPVTTNWNHKLIYHFKGGISMGFRQGVMRLNRLTKEVKSFLEQGYAIAYSTGNETSTHYNIWLAEDTALRVKNQFTSQYGKPEYTIGMGGSGGGIQQYLLAQNHPGIIDAGLALYSYPDMITQVAYTMDCELLEYYFDRLASANKLWQDYEVREHIQGLNNLNDYENTFNKYRLATDIANLRWPDLPSGASECSNSWRGPHATISNPRYIGEYYRFANPILEQIQFSHWNNLVQFYGTDDKGWANTLYDNQGVQYGLQALKTGTIDIETFFHLNSHIGGWKAQPDMKNEFYWHASGMGGLSDFKLWSQHNMTHEGKLQPNAPRAVSNSQPIEAAYRSGHIFMGKVDIPMIDLRPYRDDELDMHHSWSSFSSRLRIKAYAGHANNQLIWTTKRPFKGYKEALAVIEDWMNNLKTDPTLSVSAARPKGISDRCYDKHGNLEHEGENVWDGAWNNKEEGACAQSYPIMSSSRIIAGDSYISEVLKCSLQPVETAIQKGIYGPIDMSPHIHRLKDIFPDGVCDYEAPPIGKPDIDLFNKRL